MNDLVGVLGLVGGSAAALAFSFAVLGYMGFRLGADKKGKQDMDREYRKTVATWSGRSMGVGFIMGLLQFGLQSLMAMGVFK